MNYFTVKVITPVSRYVFEKVSECSFTSEYGKTGVKNMHADYISSFSASNIVLSKKDSKEIYKAFRGVAYFNNQKNQLSFVCAGFDKDFVRVVELKTKKIKTMLESNKYSKYTVRYLENERIALEKVVKL